MTARRPLIAGAWALIIGILAASLWASYVDVPHWDDWVFYCNQLRLAHSDFPLQDLIAQHNEHRLLFTRLVGFLLLRWFSFQAWPAIGLNVLMGCAIAALACTLMRRTGQGAHAGWHGAATALLILSTAQWQTYGWGFANQILVPPLACLGALLLLRTRPGAWTAIAWTATLFALAAFSFGSGLFLWVAVLPTLYASLSASPRRPAILAGWLAAAALIFLLYFQGYQSPPHHPSLSPAHALSILVYALAFLGNPMVPLQSLWPVAAIMGALGATGFIVLLLGLRNKIGERGMDITPWLTLAGFALLAALATAANRSGFGFEHALQSRYATTANLFWVAGIGLAHAFPENVRRVPGIIRNTFAALVVVMLSVTTLAGTSIMIDRKAKFVTAHDSLFTLENDTALRAIFPDPASLMRVLPRFFDERLGPYHAVPRLAALIPGGTPAGVITTTITEESGPCGAPGVAIKGQLTVPAGRGSYILFIEEGRAVFATTPQNDGSFSAFIPSSFLKGNSTALQAVLADGHTASPSGSTETMAVPRPPWPKPFVDQHFFGAGTGKCIETFGGIQY